nr:MAG TPA: hypothetical protein [Caudoviricetes sp.]
MSYLLHLTFVIKLKGLLNILFVSLFNPTITPTKGKGCFK